LEEVNAELSTTCHLADQLPLTQLQLKQAEASQKQAEDGMLLWQGEIRNRPSILRSVSTCTIPNPLLTYTLCAINSFAVQDLALCVATDSPPGHFQAFHVSAPYMFMSKECQAIVEIEAKKWQNESANQDRRVRWVLGRIVTLRRYTAKDPNQFQIPPGILLVSSTKLCFVVLI
jgi:hypothetical protein